MSEQKSPFESLSKNFTAIIAIFIAYGIFQINGYYKDNYNFDVIPYLSAPEILTLSFLSIGNFSFNEYFLNLLVFSICLTVLVIIVNKICPKAIFTYRNQSVVYTWTFFFMFFSLRQIFRVYELIELNDLNWTDFEKMYASKNIFAACMMLILYAVLAFVTYDVKESLTDIDVSSFAVGVMFLTFFYFSQFTYSREANKIKFKNYYAGTVIKTADSTYVSDSCSTYIGRTTNNVFIYDTYLKSMLVIRESEIKSINLTTQQKTIK